LSENKKRHKKELDSRLRGNDEQELCSPGGVEPLAREDSKTELDYTRLLPRALRAIRCANVRFGILPTQSRLRWNDEQGQELDSRLRGNDEHGHPRLARE
jgi:hypothetical protein